MEQEEEEEAAEFEAAEQMSNWNFHSFQSDHSDPFLLESAGGYDLTFDFFPSPPRTSAFAEYVPLQWGVVEGNVKEKKKNVHRRMAEFLRRIPTLEEERSGDDGRRGSRCFRHMMRERQRRERLSQSYADLHAMVSSSRSKGDKNSIVRSTVGYLLEQKEGVEELRRRNAELQAKVKEGRDRSEEPKIRLRVGKPSSSVESMIGALRCLKELDVKARSIACSSDQNELSATIAIQTQMESKKVERAVEAVLIQVERNLRSQQLQCPSDVEEKMGGDSSLLFPCFY